MPNDSIDNADSWRSGPVHPFVAKFSAKGGRVAGKEIEDGIDLKRVFEHGLQFESSRDLSGLQLVDTVAYVVRSPAAEAPKRGRLLYDPQRLNVGEEGRSSIDRYRPQT